MQPHQILDGGGYVFFRERHQPIVVAAQAEFAVELIPAHLGQVIALGAEERVFQQ